LEGLGQEEWSSGIDRARGTLFFSITRMRPIRSWRDYVQSISCLLSAQWRHVASSPLPSAQAYLSQEM